MSTEETLRQLDLALDRVDQVGGALAGMKTLAGGALAKIDDALTQLTTARANVVEIAGLANQAMDGQMEVVAALDAAKAALADTGTTEPPQPPGMKVLARLKPTQGTGLRTRNEFHQLFEPGPGITPWREWHSKAGVNRNASEWWTAEGGVITTMMPQNPAAPERAGSSESHEAWIYFDRRYLKARMSYDLLMVPPWQWPLTGKTMGLVGWNGEWPQWPGGFNGGPGNASVRIIWNDWGHRGNPRLGAYLYLGGVFKQTEVSGHAANYVDPSNGGHSVEYLIHDYGAPREGVWLPIVVDVSADATSGRGDLVVTIEGREVLRAGNLPWFTPETKDKGWNTGYPCGLFGGNTPEYNPAGGSRSWGYRNVVWQGM